MAFSVDNQYFFPYFASYEAVLTNTHNLCFFFSQNKQKNIHPGIPHFSQGAHLSDLLA